MARTECKDKGGGWVQGGVGEKQGDAVQMFQYGKIYQLKGQQVRVGGGGSGFHVQG